MTAAPYRPRVRRAAFLLSSTAATIGGMCATGIVAFACCPLAVPLALSPPSGPVGTPVSTSAHGLVAGGRYAIHLAVSNCWGSVGVQTLGKVRADSSGSWSNFTVVIPENTTMGTHRMCGVELSPVKGQTGTQSTTFTVT